jgi:LPXTG-motif cell wall-anchored protein
LVTFSEAVQLPSENPEKAFDIVEDVSKTALEVLSVAMNPKDDSNKSVVLTTSTQNPDVNYVVTAGIEIKDITGNPIESGTSDTAVFKGSGADPAVFNSADDNETDTVAPTLSSVSTVDASHLKVKFSEPVVLDVPSKNDFVITKVSDINSVLEIKSVEMGLDDSEINVTTSEQEAVDYNFVVLAEKVKDNAGNTLDSKKNATVFTGIASAQNGDNENVTPSNDKDNDVVDDKAPADATHFVATLMKTLVHLSWIASVNTDEDLAKYVLYQSTDGVKYGNGTLLDPSTLSYDVKNLVPGVKYFFKLTAKDSNGNESDGVIASISFVLPETGPEMLFLLGGSFGLGGLITRKKKKNKVKK